MIMLSAFSGSSDRQPDNRRVALLKSLTTNNRFYLLVDPDSGLKNADTIECFPEGSVLGIAYPCLEDGLNDFAIIRSTFETLDQFPDDEELRTELMEIIADAQRKLILRLEELRDRISDGQAHFLGTDLEEFKGHVVNLATKGVPRKTLDSMMKLDIFETVASTEALLKGDFAPEFVYIYEPLPENPLDDLLEMPPRPFIGRIFDDVLKSVLAEENYGDRHIFDRNVFQKFVALMFVNYATTDPVFYGTNKADYGVSADKDMDQTPLYVAVGKALRLLERQRQQELQGQGEIPLEAPCAAVDATELSPTDQLVLARLLPICDTARLLVNLDSGRARECGEHILREVHHLFSDLQEMGVVSYGAASPVEQDYRDE
ncbi:MAG TPA: hypothetical protein GX715_09255 [Armatimonadetes bacterium]|jgi:hypothetical protein|nr:hypothetical protein [Armatimonadota bacterium]